MSTDTTTLTPDQAEFLRRFFRDEHATIAVLMAPIGSGKAHLASVIASETLAGQGGSVLVISDRLIVARSIAERVTAEGAHLIPLTREWVWGHDVENLPWPSRFVAYGAMAAVSRPPVDYAIHKHPWDLVILDAGSGRGVPPFRPAETARWLQKVPTVRRQLVLLDPTAQLDEWEELPSARITAWGGRESAPVALERYHSTALNFERSPGEVALIQQARACDDQLAALGLSVETPSLDASANSSPLALQSTAARLAGDIRQIRNRLAHGLPPEGASDLVQWGEVNPADIREMEILAGALDELARRATESTIDAKLEALATWLSTLPAQGAVVVICGFRTTADYVAGRIAEMDQGRPVFTLEDRTIPSGAALRNEIIVATDGRLLGVEFGPTGYLVNYDVPEDATTLYIRLTRFRLGADAPVPLVVYLRDTEPSEREERALRQFEALMRSSDA